MFYLFNQCNSGGYFIVSDKVCHRLFIEADDGEEALQIAENLGCYWDGVNKGLDCPCCGDRWYTYYDEIDINKMKNDGYEVSVCDSIEEYAQYLANTYGRTSPDARIFYKDGNIKEIFKE